MSTYSLPTESSRSLHALRLVDATDAAITPALRTSAGPKILLYSHDTFGLGNIRRSLLLCQTLRERWPEAAIVLVTGSPVIHSFRIPEGIDYIKLPCLDRVDADKYEPRFLASWSDEVTRMRRAILKTSVLGFAPDLMIVDKRAGGVDGELLETIRTMRKQNMPTRLVLGIRDILDDPEKTNRSLRRTGDFELMDRYYDEVWIYGEQSIFDAVGSYGFPEAVARKTHFCGYLRRPSVLSRRKAGPTRVLVTTGGGGDGSDIVEAYLEGLQALPRSVALKTTVVFGPEMSTEKRNGILERYSDAADVDFVNFEPDLTARYAEADVVVSMAGYNTVCELLSSGSRAVLVPRGVPVAEQLLRAQIFAKRGDFEMIHPDELDPQRLMSKVLALAGEGPKRRTVDLNGLDRLVDRAQSLLRS